MVYKNWKKALEDCLIRHTQMLKQLPIAGVANIGTIQIEITNLENTIQELEQKIKNFEAEQGIVPQDAAFPLVVSPQTKSVLENLRQQVETFKDLEQLPSTTIKDSQDMMSALNKYRNELAAFFVVPSGIKIMDSSELKKKYINHTLFDKLASGTLLGIADKHDLDDLFNNTDEHLDYYRAVIVSALTLGLMQKYDPQKVILLINIINQGEPFVWKRALVGLTVGLMNKDHELNDDIVRRLEGLKEKPSVQKEFINLALAFEDIEKDMIFIQNFSGAIKLQDCFEFFEIPVHWFLPFYPNNDILKETKSLREPLRTLLTETVSWSLDIFKYAFCKNYHLFEDWQKKRAIEILEEEKKGITDCYPEELEKDYPKAEPLIAAKFSSETKEYLHNLVFFSQNAPKETFRYKIFETNTFYQTPIFEYTLSEKTIKQINADKNHSKGDYYKEIGEYHEAITCYKEAVKHKVDKHESWHNMGWNYERLENYAQAIECYKQAIKHKVDKHESWHNMGWNYSRLENYVQAIECYKEAVKHKVDEHESWHNMGWNYSRLENYAQAIECYKQAIKHKVDKHESWMAIGFTYIIIGDLENAKIHLIQSIELGSIDFGNMNLGHIYLCEKNEDLAIDAYLVAVSNFENKSQFWEGFDDDYQYLIQYGIDQDYYQGIKQILRNRLP